MPLHRIRIAALLATALPGVAVAQPSPPSSRPAVKPIRFAVDRFTLANGLTVIVHSNWRNPNIFVGVYYRVGSKDEPAGRTGFAHLFEHLMFQPTAHRAGDYTAPLAAAGVDDANASTHADYTEYHQSVPTNALDLALWLESDRMAHLAGGLTQAVLDEQRAVVKNEARGIAERPLADRRFETDFYPAGHPYTHPTIGSMDDLDAATLAEVKDWYGTYYGAGNAILVLSGDIDVATARQKVAQYFADVPHGPALARPRPPVLQLSADRRKVYHDHVPTPVITRVWSIDPAAARDMTLLQLAQQTMRLPGTASLYETLVTKGGIATSVDTDLDEGQLATNFSLSIALRPGVTVAAGEAALDTALARYLAQGPEQSRLAAIAALTDQSLLRSLQDNATVGTSMALGELYLGDPANLLRHRDWTAGATRAQVRTVVGRWLSRPFYQQTILPGDPEPLPPVAPPALATTGTTVGTATASAPAGKVDRSRMPALGPFKDEVAFPPITRMKLANGMTLIVAERHDLPIVDAYMQFATGTLADLRYTPGTAEQAFRLMTAGTTTRDEPALIAERERLAIAIGGTRAARRSSFSWSMASDKAEAGFALAADMLRHPAYPQARIDAYNAAASARRDAYRQQPQNAAPMLLANALWGQDDPRGHIIGAEEVRPLSRNALLAFHDRELAPDTATLVMMGDVTPEQARRLAERHFGGWRRTGEPLADTTRAVAPAKGRVILVDAPGATQSMVLVGQLVGAFDVRRRGAEIVADAALAGGFDSRINMNLRGDRAWTYNFVGSIADAPTGPRVYSAGGAIETAHTAAAMAEIRREVTALVTTRPITAAELAERRAAAIHAVPPALDSDGELIEAMVRANDHDRPLDDARHAGARLAAVTLDEVNRVARETYRPDDLTWVVVGDLSKIERDVRALGLAPVEVRDVYGKLVR
ncbi:pitrilysin family protein [Sphingomonas cynarae]|uniref:Pitrilysin family protein n=1 Tax=Sphingomonas cynarae TaxID=930197 RepID=A0ABP7EFP3_9SPHN